MCQFCIAVTNVLWKIICHKTKTYHEKTTASTLQVHVNNLLACLFVKGINHSTFVT